MLYIKAVIKTDFHTYFYRTIVLKKGTGNPLLDPPFHGKALDTTEDEIFTSPLVAREERQTEWKGEIEC